MEASTIGPYPLCVHSQAWGKSSTFLSIQALTCLRAEVIGIGQIYPQGDIYGNSRFSVQ